MEPIRQSEINVGSIYCVKITLLEGIEIVDTEQNPEDCHGNRLREVIIGIFYEVHTSSYGRSTKLLLHHSNNSIRDTN